jgi:hypothetical protein
MASNLTLHMGFLNTPYTDEARQAPARFAKSVERLKRRRSFSRTMTAEKVSKILEGKYNIVETFNEIYEDDINALIHEGFKEVAEHVIMNKGGDTRAKMKNLMKPYTNQVQRMFKAFIDDEEMNNMVPGVPTKVSIKGRRGRRPGPSFLRTGIYKASFRAWVE